MNRRSNSPLVRRRRSTPHSERGIALVELAIIIFPLLLLVFSGFECTSYMRQRQVAQMLSRETAVKIYRKCSGFETPVPGQPDPLRAQQCFADAIADMRSVNGSAAAATFEVGLYRCDPPTEDVACTTPALAASLGNVVPFTTRMETSGDPLRNLIISQRAAIAVRVSFPYRSPIVGSMVYAGLSALQLGEIVDVTIL